MKGRTVWAVIACVAVVCAAALPATAQRIDAKEYRLDNGMQVLLVERHEAPTIMASIFARVGSSNETDRHHRDLHLFEHMMFKGTETLGTKDIKRDREVMAKLDSLRVLMREEQRIMRERLRRGEIESLTDPEAKTPRYREIDAVFDSLILEQRELIIKDHIDELYSKNGGFFLNAFTSEDMTGTSCGCRKTRSICGCGLNRTGSTTRCSVNFIPNATWCAKKGGWGSNRRRPA